MVFAYYNYPRPSPTLSAEPEESKAQAPHPREHLPQGHSTSIGRNDDRLSVRIEMSKQPYMAPLASHQDRLSRTEANLPDHAAQPSSAYSELAPYSTVSSFTLPASCDSALLTPVSNAGSPLLRQRSKLVSAYRHPSTPGQQQQLTPPGSSKMHWSPSYDMNGGTSQGDSPMGINPAVTSGGSFDMVYMTNGASNRTGKEEDIPPPLVEPFFGSFGVSGADSEQETIVPQQQLYMQQPQYYAPMAMQVNQGPLLMRHRTPTEMAMATSHSMRGQLAQSGLAAPPTLQHPSPDDYHHHQPRRSSGDDLAMNHYNPGPPTDGSPKRKDSRASAKVTKRTTKPRGRRTDPLVKAAVRADSQGRRASQEAVAAARERGNLDEMRSRIKDDCPEEERWLAEAKFRHRDTLGKGMWGVIRKEYKERFGKDSELARLQMMWTRLKSKHIHWTAEEKDKLLEAVNWSEQNRYKMIHAKFKELGGCQDIDFNPTNVEMMLVEMGIEEAYYLDQLENKVRRRKKLGNSEEPSPSSKARSSTSPGRFSDLTLEQKDDILDQIDQVRRLVKTEETPEPEPGSHMDMSFHQQSMTPNGGGRAPQGGSISGSSGVHESARVALQACNEMMGGGGGSMAPQHYYHHDPRVIS